jgi:hypothetical protein
MSIFKKKKFFLLTVATFALCIIIFMIHDYNKVKDIGSLPISYVGTTYAIDVDDLCVLTGYSDYVFIGQVEETLRTDNSNYLPKTYYSVNVLDNLKGELPLNEPVMIGKDGGLTKKRDIYVIFENDIMPEENGIYIFIALVGSKGELSISGRNSTILIESASSIQTKGLSIKNINGLKFADYEVYNDFIYAIENQETFEKERFPLLNY